MRALTVATGLLLCACSESPFAPAPSTHPCGSDDWPCPFDCQLDCAARAVLASQSCVLTLEGTLDAARTTCSFGDGSQVLFGEPVPAGAPGGTWDLRIVRGGQTCLQLRTTGPGGQTDLTFPGGQFHQELSWAGGDLGLRGIGQAQVRCADGRLYSGPAASCARCADAGGCQLDGLLTLQVTGKSPLIFSLQSGSQLAPLFTCR